MDGKLNVKCHKIIFTCLCIYNAFIQHAFILSQEVHQVGWGGVGGRAGNATNSHFLSLFVACVNKAVETYLNLIWNNQTFTFTPFRKYLFVKNWTEKYHHISSGMMSHLLVLWAFIHPASCLKVKVKVTVATGWQWFTNIFYKNGRACRECPDRHLVVMAKYWILKLIYPQFFRISNTSLTLLGICSCY